MSERGFSLIQVLLLGALLIGLGLALSSMLSNRAKTDGELERRQRYHDLVEEAGFVFRTQAQCAEALPKLQATRALAVREDLVLAAGAALPEYGVRIDGVALENVVTKESHNPLLMSIGLSNLADHTCRIFDVVVSASPLAGHLPLKAQRIARVMEIQKSGLMVQQESFCQSVDEGETCPN